MAATNDLTVEWFGCTTFRIRVAGLTLWFDTFVDRVPPRNRSGSAPATSTTPTSCSSSHAHFDHVLGADTVAKNTGAPIVGSYESIHVMRDNGVEPPQLWAVSGGERVDCGNDVSVHVFPSLHSCLFAGAELDTGTPCLGDLGMPYQERRERVDALCAPDAERRAGRARAPIEQGSSRHDGGQLNYLLETPRGTVFVAASTGYWSGILRDLRADVAVLAVTGRPNLDGEPFQGSLADFVVGEVATLQPEEVVFCRHDTWMPPLPALDPRAGDRGDRGADPNATVVHLGYGDPVRLRH